MLYPPQRPCSGGESSGIDAGVVDQPSIHAGSQAWTVQHANKAVALKIIKARLYELQIKAKEKKIEDIIGDKKDIAWGSQIRSYVMQPYQMVKDHRTDFQSGNSQAVLDGDLDGFMEAYLKSTAK